VYISLYVDNTFMCMQVQKQLEKERLEYVENTAVEVILEEPEDSLHSTDS